jgi:hypothetical protein
MEARKDHHEEEQDEEREVSSADLASRSATERREQGEPDDERDDEDRNRVMTSTDQDEFIRDDTNQPLLPDEEGSGFRERWERIQTSFVDEPRKSVEEADRLVAEVMQRLARSFADERSDLEQQWDRGEDVSTEDLRVSLQRYRAFFARLLAA